MGLNSNLISQFAKATVSKKDENKESTVWATVHEVTDSGQCYVKLDGADDGRLIPVETMAETKKDDRVSVTIRNHTATLTGNASSPAVGISGSKITKIQASVGEFDTLNAKDGFFENVRASVGEFDKLNAKEGFFDTIKASVGEFETLAAKYISAGKINAEHAEVKELFAGYATINHLEANYATISKLTAAEADIVDLQATTANIGDLTATVGKIDTLMFGAASGTSIQTEFANTVVSQIGIAQIKSAMIESISASKIKTGTLYTNLIDVQSESGNLKIADATIQVKDDNDVVRVQIGKDGSNDYSIVVCDSSGNVMFHEGGITENAVKEAIIRNDMVSENANISAGKLDIASLFTEINKDGSNVIKSSKIYLNEQNQTLDVAFQSMTDSVSDMGSNLSSQGTAISTVLGQISQRIWQQDTSNTFDSESISSPNLVLNSNTLQANASSTYHRVARYKVSELLKADEEYTATICVTPADGITHFGLYLSQGYGVNSARFGIEKKGTQIISATFNPVYTADRIPTNTTDANSEPWIYQFPNYNTVTKSSTIHWIKIEKGNKATNWTPAPSEMEEYTTSLSTKYSTLEQTVNGITSSVSKIEGTFAGNLIKDFNTVKTNDGTTNLVAGYAVNSLLVAGEKYRVIICITPAEGAKYLNTYLSQGYSSRNARLELDGTENTQIVSGTLTAAYAEGRIPENTSDLNSRVLVYQYDNSAAFKAVSTIHWIKVEKYNDAVLTAMQSSIDQTPEKITLAVSSVIVGGRNFVLDSNSEQSEASSTSHRVAWYKVSELLEADEEYTVTICVTPATGITHLGMYLSQGSSEGYNARFDVNGTGTQVISKTFTVTYATDRVPTSASDANSQPWIYQFPNYTTVTESSKIHWIKIEKGNKATDWTPAPEDVDGRLGDQESASNKNTTDIVALESRIKVLEDGIEFFVTDGNNTNTINIDETSSTWSFNSKYIDDAVGANAKDIGDVKDTADSAASDATAAKNKLAEWEERVKITKYEDEPCIILNEDDSSYEQIITNTRRIIKEGNTVKSEVNLDTAKFGKVIATNGWQVGKFAWTQPSSNRLRLVWEEGE